MRLYHYRPLETALMEIRNSSFHFSSREELNDPIEGYVRVYWQGDVPAWEGLLGNFVVSLFDCLMTYLLAGDTQRLRQSAVRWDIHALDDRPLGAVCRELQTEFWSDPYVQRVAAFYGEKETPCGTDELAWILGGLCEAAFPLCVHTLKKKRMLSPEAAEKHLPYEDMLDLFLRGAGQAEPGQMWQAAIQAGQAFLRDLQEMLYRKLTAELETITDPQDPRRRVLEQQYKWLLLRMDFPRLYLEGLQRITYPNGYTVSFSACNDSSVMWGNYAENHRGVCLIYQTQPDGDRETLTVQTGLSYGSGDKEVTHTFRREAVWPVRYGGAGSQRNFFETLGRLNGAQATAWLTGRDGTVSRYRERLHDGAWHERYWQDFLDKHTHKLESWGYEHEYRLLLDDLFFDYSQKETRNIRYDPAALTGIIFGIKTELQQKERLLQALKETGRPLQALEFYQAEYDEAGQAVRIRRKLMDLP